MFLNINRIAEKRRIHHIHFYFLLASIWINVIFFISCNKQAKLKKWNDFMDTNTNMCILTSFVLFQFTYFRHWIIIIELNNVPKQTLKTHLKKTGTNYVWPIIFPYNFQSTKLSFTFRNVLFRLIQIVRVK